MSACLRPLCPIALLFLLSACAAGTPACGDADTLDLLDEIVDETFQEHAYGRKARPMVEYTVRSIRTLGHDDDVDSYQCAATLELRPKDGRSDKTVEQAFEYDIYAVEDEQNDFEIRYDDGIKRAVVSATTATIMEWN